MAGGSPRAVAAGRDDQLSPLLLQIGTPLPMLLLLAGVVVMVAVLPDLPLLSLLLLLLLPLLLLLLLLLLAAFLASSPQRLGLLPPLLLAPL